MAPHTHLSFVAVQINTAKCSIDCSTSGSEIVRGDWNEKHLKRQLVGSRMRWTGHVQRMGDTNLLTRVWQVDEGDR